MPTSLSRINQKIQRGNGKAAGKLGQTYDIRRLTPTTSGSVLMAPPTIQSFPASIERITKKDAIENATFDILTFDATCDNRKLLLGDVCTETGYQSNGGTYVVAQMRPLQITIWARADFRATIERPPNTDVPPGAWDGEQRAINEQLVLNAGAYSYATITTSPALVPIGVQPISRYADQRTPNIPDGFAAIRYLVYCPPLPGATLQEQDQIVIDDDNRYEVMSIYSSTPVGLNGYICVVRKLD